MFVRTVHLKKQLLSAAGAICLALLATAAALFSPKAALPASAPLSDNAGRLQFLAGYGWEAQEEPTEILQVIIPAEFDATYQSYNDIQTAQGLDLTPYRGMTVRRYTYRVVNYPGVSDEVLAHLFLYRDRVIAGDICSVALNGFLHGFSYPG